jgi:predicted chitinase
VSKAIGEDIVKQPRRTEQDKHSNQSPEFIFGKTRIKAQSVLANGKLILNTH